MALYRAFATVGAMTIWSRILGFIRDVMIAAVLGAGPVADAFFVAFRVPNLFRRLFAEGAFDAAFVPLFAKRFHGDGGEVAARAFAEQALAGLTLILVVFTLLGEFIMPWLMLLLAPGFASDPPKLALAVLLARIALPFLLCMSLVALYSGVLNALGRFAVAAFAPSLLNVVLIAVLVALIAIGDVEQSTAAMALAWGIAASGVLQVIVVAVAAAKSKMRLSFRLPRFDADMRRLLVLAAPALIAGGMNQLTVILNTIIASLQDRVVSWFYYADRLFQLPLGVIGVAVGVVLLPELSRRLRAGDHAAAMDSENRSLETALLLTLPAAVALFVAAHPIVRVLFERGAFTAIDAQATAVHARRARPWASRLRADQGVPPRLLRPRGHADADDLCRHRHGGERHARASSVRRARRRRHRHRHHHRRLAPGGAACRHAARARRVCPRRHLQAPLPRDPRREPDHGRRGLGTRLRHEPVVRAR